MFICVKFGFIILFVGVELSENFDFCCVEKFLCKCGLGLQFCLIDEDFVDDSEVDECVEREICEGGDLGLK